MKKNKKAYSVMIALLMIGFLLVIVVGVFNLVLKELNDNRGMGNYIKTFFGAEAGQELALLQIKKKGYGYSDSIDFSINDRSVVLSEKPTQKSLFKANNDILISYDLPVKTNSYTGVLSDLGYDIIPLYHLTGSTSITEEKVTNIALKIESGTDTDLVWNIIGSNSGFSGIGEFNGDSEHDIKVYVAKEFNFQKDVKIKDFLRDNTTNFLILLNSGDNDLTYNLETTDSSEYFSKPKIKIFSSSKIGNYRQNLSTNLDNNEYFKILKYSIFSN